MKPYQPEIGQALFGQPYKQYGVPNYLVKALETLDEFLSVKIEKECGHDCSPFSNTGNSYKCDVFEVEAYSWNEDIEQPYNFKWKDLEVSWYKYLGRGMSMNRETSPKEVKQLLQECLDVIKE